MTELMTNMGEVDLREKINNARKNNNQSHLKVYKAILEEAQKIAKAERHEVLDKDILTAAKREIKRANDTLSYYKIDSPQYDNLKTYIEIAETFLPPQATEGDILYVLKGLTITSEGNAMGQCMKALKVYFGDALDGKLASQVVKNYLA